MEEEEAGGGKPDRWSLDRPSVLEVVEDCGTDMAEASEVLWGKDLAVCTDSGGSIRRCYASAGNRNRRLDTGMNPLLISKHRQSPRGGVRERRRGGG